MVNFYIYYNTHTHTHTYFFINIKNSGKPETVHRYGPISEIYRTAGQTGTTSGMVLTPLLSAAPLPLILWSSLHVMMTTRRWKFFFLVQT